MLWTHALPAVSSAFLASIVEVVEAFTIVLAVGTVRGWKPALTGAFGALATLALLVALLGPLLGRVPIHLMQILIGTLLLLFGLRWLRKAILRAAGVIPLHDEAAIFVQETQALRLLGGRRVALLDVAAAATTFKAVLLEGLEVVFIVIAIGAAGGLLLPASVGAAAACVLVLAVGVLLHQPLARVPENSLKLGVGVMLTAFGVFWTAEGLGYDWLGHDWALLVLSLLFLGAALACVPLCRRLSQVQMEAAR